MESHTAYMYLLMIVVSQKVARLWPLTNLHPVTAKNKKKKRGTARKSRNINERSG